MPKIVELRQDRNYVRNNFDGYKLSLDAVPIIRQEHQSSPRNVKPNDSQYSLLHVELFSMQNLLIADPWARYSTYFINLRGEVTRCNYDENVGRPDSMQIVYNFNAKEFTRGDYNYSMRFISEKYCVVCDGKRKIMLLETGDRRKAMEWKQIAQATISNEENEQHFMLYDCRLDIIQEQKQISLALGRVHNEDNDENCSSGGGSTHFMRLHWAHWIQKDVANWELKIIETLEGKGSIYYCAFEPRAESLIVSSNREYCLKSQKRSMETMEMETEKEEKPQLHGDTIDEYNFSWAQSNDDVVIEFPIEFEKTKSDFNIRSTMEALTVKCNDDILLDQNLFSKIDMDLTTWTFQGNLLEITLTKQTPTHWLSLLANGIGPKERAAGNNAEIIPVDQQPIANLEAPIEDCDFPIGSIDYEVKIERFNLPSKSVTHSVLLGTAPPLFTTNLRAGFPMAIATRQDVDACLWLQQYNPSKPEEWSLRHEGNLHAFGYIQASKQQRKFMDCSPDLSYAVISESFRHVFLYRMNYDSANGLRNRSGPQVQLGKQHLITLDDAGEVLGLATAPNVIILLTEKCLLYLQIN